MNLAEEIQKSKQSELEFFQAAYLFTFRKIGNCVTDVCNWRLYAIVPKYVVFFIENRKA